MITGFVVLVSITTFLVCFVDCSSQTGIVGNGADVYVLEPESTFAVQYGEITFKIGVQLHPGSSLLHKNQICIREIGSSAGELCSEQSIFTVSGFSSGTHVITASLRSFADKESFQKGEYSLMGSSETVIDSVDGSYLVNHAMDSALSHRILQSDAKLSRLDYLYFPNSADRERDGGDKDITPNEYKIIGIAAMAMKEAERISGRAAVLRRKKVAFFMTTVSGIPPSDRYRDWLCEHAVFLEHGYELAIITGDDGVDEGIFGLCGVTIQRFKCLSLEYASSHTFQPEDLRDGPSAQDTHFLAEHLAGADIVIIGNTYGDPQTSLLLDLIHHMRASSDTQYKAHLNNGTVPRVLIDLPNLEVPSAWHDKVDMLIAPSKATGLHRLSISLGKPIAVIYPPVRDNVIEASLCAAQYQQDRQDQQYYRRNFSSDFLPASCTNTPTTATPFFPRNVERNRDETRVLNENVFNFIFVGRLAAVKCSGLVVRALGYLLRSAYWSSLSPPSPPPLEAVLSSGATRTGGDIPILDPSGSSSGGSEVVASIFDQELHTELLSLARAFAPEKAAEDGAVWNLLEAFRTNAHVSFVGSGELLVTKALRDLAFRLNVSDVVSFEGAQSPENVIKYMKQADVLVNPIARGETFGFIHIEAAAQGLPVIAFNMSANTESIFNVDTAYCSQNIAPSMLGGLDAGKILPFRDKYVVQDLALAMLKAFVSSAHAAEVPNITVSSDEALFTNKRLYVYRNRMCNVSAVCEKIVPMFAHWNVKQHSRALIQAIDELLKQEEVVV